MYATGTVVAGKYRLERVLGQGGMGVVMAATHLQLGTPVALKLLHADMVQNQSVVDRFMREARASAQLRSENVCRVSDVGTNDDGCPFIVMELLAGQDLVSVLRGSGALPVQTAAEVVLQACFAIGEAHAVGIVHRDLKPGNLFWTQRPDGTPCIKVLDFGVAKAPEDVNFSLTQTASVIGSPGYMSPEQLKSSKGVDGRSDIWSLGVVMYELVTGHKPFEGGSITELALKVAMDPTPTMNGVVPSSFEAVVRRCLEKEPARRYQDVADLAAALAPFVGARGFELAQGIARVRRGANTPIVPVMPAGAASTPTTLRGANAVITRTGISTRSWKVPALIGFGAACGVGLAIILLSSKKHDRPAAEPATETMRMQAEPSAPTPAVEGSPARTMPAPATGTTPMPAHDPAADEAAKAAEVEKAAAADREAKAKADADARAHEAATAKAEADAKAQADATSKADAKAKAAADAKAKANADREANAQAAADAKAKANADREANAQAAADAKAKANADRAAKAQAAADAKAKANADRAAKAQAAASAKAERRAKAQAALDAKVEAAKKAAATKSSKTTSKTSTKTTEDLGDSRF